MRLNTMSIWHKPNLLPHLALSSYSNVKSFAVMLEKVNAGLDVLHQHLPRFTDRHYDECKALADLVATPLDTPIPFAWHRADIVALLGSGLQDEDAIQREEMMAADERFTHYTGGFLLLRPADGDVVAFIIAIDSPIN